MEHILTPSTCAQCSIDKLIKTRKERDVVTFVSECSSCHVRSNIMSTTIFKNSDANIQKNFEESVVFCE